MALSSMTRREFNKLLVTSLFLGGSQGHAQTVTHEGDSASKGSPIRLRVAAIQMVPKLGDVQSNMSQAEHLIRKALQQDAQWIV